MEKRSRSTRHGYRENRTNCPDDRFPVPAPSPTTRKSSPSANEKQSRPHWRNATVEFQARTAQPPSSEFPTKPLRFMVRSPQKASGIVNLVFCSGLFALADGTSLSQHR